MNRVLSFLAIAIVIGACGDKGKKAPVEAGDWTENAVIYEMNIRQGTDSWKGIDVARGLITNMMESSYFKT